MLRLAEYLAVISTAIIASSQSSHLSVVFPEEICLLRSHPQSFYSSANAAAAFPSTSEFQLTIVTELDRMIAETYGTVSLRSTSTGMFLNCYDDPADSLRLRDDDLMQRKTLFTLLQNDLSGRNLTLEAFGSCCNGFGLVRSDLDVMLTGNITMSELIPQLPKEFSVQYISKRKPLIVLQHSDTGLPVDVLVNRKDRNNMALFMWYLRKASRFDSRAQVLGIFLKAVVKKLKINDTKCVDLSSSMYITMLIHYLQQMNPPVLPGIPHRKNNAESFVVRNNATVGQLWLGFLRYYVHEFNYEENVICLYNVDCKTRKERGWYGPDHNMISIESPTAEESDNGMDLLPIMSDYILRVFNQLLTFYLKDNYDGLLRRNALNLDYHPRYGHKTHLLVNTWSYHNRTSWKAVGFQWIHSLRS